MDKRSCSAIWMAAWLLAYVINNPSHAQAISPDAELRAQVDLRQRIPLPDAGVFGEQYNPLTGELMLEQVDVFFGTNGLPVSLARSFSPGESPRDTPRNGAFADWQMELPRITTLTVRYDDGHGWRVAGDNPYARCNAFGAPPSLALHDGKANPDAASSSDTLDPDAWWQGYQLRIPGLAQQEILHRDPANTLIPAMNGAEGRPLRFPLLTAQQWQIACLGQTDNGEPGEGFLAVSPAGLRYVFNHLVYAAAPASSLGELGTLERFRASMLVTRIEDRFGNVLDFTYDRDRLIAISNGHEAGLRIDYRGDIPSLVERVVLNSGAPSPRIWTYRYDGLGSGRETLVGVGLPDGTTWNYKLQSLSEAALDYRGESTCRGARLFDASQAFTGSMTSPQGLTQQLTLKGFRHGRAGVTNTCGKSFPFPWVPAEYDTLSLVQRGYSGPSVGTPTWSYRYSAASESPAWTELIDPDGRVSRTTFSNAADQSEGRVLSVDTDRHANGSASRRVTFDYAQAGSGPYPGVLGSAPRSRSNAAAEAVLQPLVRQSLFQDGDTYTTEFQAFNAFAQPTLIRRSNNMAGQPSLGLELDYLNDASHWMLGLTTAVTDKASRQVILREVYDLANVTLIQQDRFGSKEASYSYTSQGLLASMSDGNGLTTQYQDHLLGQPRRTVYADGTSESALLDSFGNVVSRTDRAGTATHYDYDSMGRVTRIGAPQSDSVGWNDTVVHYEYDPQSHWGLQGGHWRTHQQRGSVITLTYYDALQRPLLSFLRDNGNDISFRRQFDWKGRVVFEAYPVNGFAEVDQQRHGTRTDYDALGRVIRTSQHSEHGALVTAITYLAGARTQTTDPKGVVTTRDWQVLDDPIDAEIVKVSAAEGVTQTVVRDAYGLPLSITQSGLYENAPVSLTRHYIYDSHKRLCRTIEPEAGSAVVDYDAGGRIAWTAQGAQISGSDCGREQVSDAGKTRRTYDVMNRLLSVAYPAGTRGVSFGYDALGLLAYADTGTSRWSYGYNKRGLPVSETLTVEGVPYTIGHRYNANGSLVDTTYPDGRVVDYAPDGWGRPTKAGSFAATARYLAAGALEYFRYGNGIEYLAEQNARQLPKNMSYVLPSGGLLFSQDFSYDTLGNLSHATDLSDTASTRRDFAYDALGRLTRAVLPGAVNSETYAYDPLNNIRRVVNDSGLQRDYQYDPLNRLNHARGANGQVHQFAYDARGNVIQRDATPFTFDFANQLTEVVGRESYDYDAFGHRVLKTRLGVGGGKSVYVYSRSGQLLFQRDHDVASSETDFIYLGGVLVAQATTRKLDQPGAISFTPGSPTDGNYTIAWGSAGGAATYELEESHDGGAWQAIYRGGSTSYTYSMVDNQRLGGTYTYRLRACASTCGQWMQSGPMGVSPRKTARFHLPQGIQRFDYTVAWEPSYSASAYDIEEGETDRSGNLVWTRVASGLPQNSLVRPGNRVGTYMYRVSSFNAHGNRGWLHSDTNQKVVVDPGEVGPPSQPRMTSPIHGMLQVRFPYALRVAWDPVARATHYEVTSNVPFSCQTVGIDCVFSAIRAGDYVMNVTACNAEGCSPPSTRILTLVAMGGIPIRTASAPSESKPERSEQSDTKSLAESHGE